MILFIIMWVVTSVLAYGFSFAHFQRKYPSLAVRYYRIDMAFCLAMSIFPLVSFISVFILGFYKYGLKFY